VERELVAMTWEGLAVQPVVALVASLGAEASAATQAKGSAATRAQGSVVMQVAQRQLLGDVVEVAVACHRFQEVQGEERRRMIEP
jgi:hypothetical protein